MTGLNIDIKNTEIRLSKAMTGSSLIKAAKEFPTHAAQSLASTSATYGYTGAAKALSTGRIDDLAYAVGPATINSIASDVQQAVGMATGAAAGIVSKLLRSIGVGPAPEGSVMLTLGGFSFMVSTAAHQTITRNATYRWATQDRLQQRPAKQWLGEGEQKIELSGYLLPEFTGGAESLEALRDMAKLGQPFELIDHFGGMFGLHTIESIEASGSALDIYGQPRRIDFKISLSSYGEDDAMGSLGQATAEAIENANQSIARLT